MQYRHALGLLCQYNSFMVFDQLLFSLYRSIIAEVMAIVTETASTANEIVLEVSSKISVLIQAISFGKDIAMVAAGIIHTIYLAPNSLA